MILNNALALLSVGIGPAAIEIGEQAIENAAAREGGDFFHRALGGIAVFDLVVAEPADNAHQKARRIALDKALGGEFLEAQRQGFRLPVEVGHDIAVRQHEAAERIAVRAGVEIEQQMARFIA